MTGFEGFCKENLMFSLWLSSAVKSQLYFEHESIAILVMNSEKESSKQV
jgi:hypothetical protein